MEDFRNLTFQEEKLRKGIQKFEVNESRRILPALDFAKEAHENQKRDEGDPYVIHPIRIANILIYDLNIAISDMIIAGLLHDVVEDTPVSLEEIKQRFGETVAKVVAALTRDKNKETKQEKFEKTIKGSENIKLLKACDWLDNLRSMPFRTDRGERWTRHLEEAREMYIPLAEMTKNNWLIEEMKKAYEKVAKII